MVFGLFSKRKREENERLSERAEKERERKERLEDLRSGMKSKDIADADAISSSSNEKQKKWSTVKRDRSGNPVDSKDPSDWITPQELDHIRDHLVQNAAPLVIRGMLDLDARNELREIVKRDHRTATRGKDFLIDYITRETVGTGVIEDILNNNPDITDIGYNGTDLIVESNDEKYIYDKGQVDDTYILRLVNKFAHANNRDFTGKNPIFDGKFENVRINAMYNTNTVKGMTMSLRIVRPQLALTEDTFYTFAPQYIYELFKGIVLSKGNIVISGETGTGKTELQKLLASHIPFDQRVVLIEDVAESFLKEMFSDKDIYSWITSSDVSITDLVKAALRNNPRWILVSETRGKEAYEMIQAVLSGHRIITTLHAINSEAIPTRLLNMAKMGYQFDEDGLRADILRYFDFGVHIERTSYKGKTIRYLNELTYFSEDGNTTLFRQDFINGKFVCQINELPDKWYRILKRTGHIPEDFVEHTIHTRVAHVSESYDNDKGVKKLSLDVTFGETISSDTLIDLVPDDHIVYDRGRREEDLAKRRAEHAARKARSREILSKSESTSKQANKKPAHDDGVVQDMSDWRDDVDDSESGILDGMPVIDLGKPRNAALSFEPSPKDVAQARLDNLKSKKQKVPMKRPSNTADVQAQANAMLKQYEDKVQRARELSAKHAREKQEREQKQRNEKRAKEAVAAIRAEKKAPEQKARPEKRHVK